MARRTLALLFTALLVGGLVAGTATVGARPAPAPAATTADGDTIDQRFVLALDPKPGQIRVHLQYHVPDDVTSLKVSVGDRVTVQSTHGFQQSGPDSYSWTKTTDRPSITYILAANKTIDRGMERQESGGYLYVDTGEWAITPTPRVGLTYSGVGRRPRINTTYGFDTPGATGGDIVFLGPHEETRTRIASQTLRLVVPTAANMKASRQAVFESLGSAAETLEIGPRDAEVVAIVAPTGQVQFASTGLQRGDSDFWVLDTQTVSSPNNVWIHEYVHTRQVYHTTNATQWSVEGMADYYAALLTYRQGRISYDRFRTHLKRGRFDRYDDDVLAEPSTWEGTLTPYDKGALVMAALDREIRLNTDGGGTLQRAIREFNDQGTTSQAEFLDAVAAVGGQQSRDFAKTYTETSATPETWSRREHIRVFGETARFTYAFSPPYQRSGPYREDSVGETPTVVTGETLQFPVVVTNVGEKPGEYHATLAANGDTVATKTGSLAPGERTTLTFEHTFTEAGTVRVAIGGAAETVTVRRPAQLTVTGLSAPRRVPPGETVTLAATVASAAARPAAGTVEIAVDGNTVTSNRVTLAADETATLTTDVTFETVGNHTVTAGSRTRTVWVTEQAGGTPEGTVTGTAPPISPTSTGAGDDRGATTGGQPGFGVLAAVAALAAVALAAGSRSV